MKHSHSFLICYFSSLQKLVGQRRDLLCNHSNAELFTREEDGTSSRESLPGKVFSWCFYNKNISFLFDQSFCESVFH